MSSVMVLCLYNILLLISCHSHTINGPPTTIQKESVISSEHTLGGVESCLQLWLSCHSHTINGPPPLLLFIPTLHMPLFHQHLQFIFSPFYVVCEVATVHTKQAQCAELYMFSMFLNVSQCFMVW